MRIKKKHLRYIVILGAAAVLLAVGSTVAFFSSRDEITNRFAGGRFDILLTETNWNPRAAENVVPGDEIAKNPQVTNNERTAGYIFLRVTVPADATAVDKADGTALGSVSKNVPLFKFMVPTSTPGEYAADENFSEAQRVRSKWMQVGSAEYDAADRTYTYVYAYSEDGTNLTPLREGETTEPLFDKLRLWNFNESVSYESDHSVLVEAFGIQSNLPGYTAGDAAEIWALLGGGGGG